MPYRLCRDRSVPDEIRRVVSEQLKGALDDVERGSQRPAHSVHQVRKRVKRVRSVLRLTRGGRSEEVFRGEDRALRDATRGLAPARDADARVEAARKLLVHERFRATLDPRLDDFLHVHSGGNGARSQVLTDLAAFGTGIERLLRRVPDWPLDAGGFGLIEGGFRKTYRRARRAMRRAERRPTASNLHEWRKHVKSHGHHCQLLFDTWAPVMMTRYEEVHGLEELLGDDHDLVLLHETVRREPDAAGGERSAADTVAAVRSRREEIRAEAFARGHFLFAERPRRFVERMRAYWEISRDAG